MQTIKVVGIVYRIYKRMEINYKFKYWQATYIPYLYSCNISYLVEMNLNKKKVMFI